MAETTDAETTLKVLRQRIAQFASERDWEQFHQPKDLAMGLSIEASELLELFLWKTTQDVDEMVNAPAGLARISEELSDVLIYTLNLANRLDIDLSAALTTKLEVNAAKYPVEKARGSSQKYSEL